MRFRDKFGVFRKLIGKKPSSKQSRSVKIDHNYSSTSLCDGPSCKNENCNSDFHLKLANCISRDGWREGRRVIELGVLMDNLKFCQSCKLGPVPLTCYNIVGEFQKGLGGYLYVLCQNPDCQYVNRVSYGKTHHNKAKGMPCFDVNTKLGTAMIDSLGGPVLVNNFLATLNLKLISNRNLKKMEERAGEVIEAYAVESARQAAHDAFAKEMEDIAQQELSMAKESMEGPLLDELGVCPLPDESPSLKLHLQANQVIGDESDSDWTDVDSDGEDDGNSVTSGSGDKIQAPISLTVSSPRTPTNTVTPVLVRCKQKAHGVRHVSSSFLSRRRLDKMFPCRTRTGMSCAIDTAWQKKGFDSLTSHTFLMSKAKNGKKVVKSVVSHRICGTCNWWRRHRPGHTVRPHKCVRNHTGSARLMESISGEKGVVQLGDEGTPVEYLEGDGDNTLIARLRNNRNIQMKKRYDLNHVVKNVGKSLYALQNKKGVKLSKMIILHLEKCLKYAFARNQGEKEALCQNLKALVPHQLGDHSLCNERFCALKRRPSELYIHKSLPYRTSLKDPNLRDELQKIFDPLIANAHQYADLGSSQQCEHANKEVSLRAPKSHHYGNTKSLDYRVHATAAFINEGRYYISETNVILGLSPGKNTVKYADKCQKRRLQKQQSQTLPSTKRRRLALKQERATSQGAMEALEGVSYQSGVGHSKNVDIEQLPVAIPRGNFQPVKVESGQPSFITLDLETTDLIRGSVMPHITQFAAMEVKTGARFGVYCKPLVPISPDAQRITGICLEDNCEMVVHGKAVESFKIKCVLEKLCSWLQKFPNVYIVAHNGRRFDFPVLMTAAEKTGATAAFLQCVTGCVDSLTVFKKKLPDQSHKQEDLVHFYLGMTYDAHNAEADVEALGHLLRLCQVSELLSCSFSPSAIQHSLLFNTAKATNIRSFDILVSRGVMKRPTAENIAGSGFNLEHLKVIYKRSGEDGLRDSFVAKNSVGLPRVTSSKKVIEEVIPKICQFF